MIAWVPALSLNFYLAIAALVAVVLLFLARGIPALLAAGLLSPGITAACLGHPELLITSACGLGAGWAVVHWLGSLLATLLPPDDLTEGAVGRLIEIIGVGSLALTPAYWRLANGSARALAHAFRTETTLLDDSRHLPVSSLPLDHWTLWVVALLFVAAATLIAFRWLTSTNVGATLATGLRWGMGSVALLVALHWLVRERGPNLWDAVMP